MTKIERIVQQAVSDGTITIYEAVAIIHAVMSHNVDEDDPGYIGGMGVEAMQELQKTEES